MALAAKGVYAVLIGSGVSRSAGMPTGWDVTLGSVRELARLAGKDPGDKPDEWHRRERGSEPDYSALLEARARTPAERRNLLQKYSEPTPEEREQGLKTPTAAHRAVASLVESGHVRGVITTNFDRLMEAPEFAEIRAAAPSAASRGRWSHAASPP